MFIPVRLLAPAGTTPQTYAFPYVLAAFVGMIAGTLIGTLVEFALKMLFGLADGRLLLKRPLTILSILTDPEDLICLSTRFRHGRKTLKIDFEHDDVGREFSALQPQESE